MACKSASKTLDDPVRTIGLFTIDEFSKIDTSMGPDTRPFFETLPTSLKEIYQQEEERQEQNEEDGQDYKPKVPWDERLDARRVNIPKTVFDENQEFVVTLGEDPKYALEISCEMTEIEQSFAKAYRHQHIGGGLAAACEYRLVFETAAQKESFGRFFRDQFPSAFLVAGSSEEEFQLAA